MMMKRWFVRIGNLIALGIIGLCIGWLVGMSVSPVVQGLITTLTALLGVLAGAVAGLPTPARENTGAGSAIQTMRRLRPWPLALLLSGLVSGAAAGIYIRTHGLLDAQTTSTSRAQPPQELSEEQKKAALGALFSARSDECGELVGKTGDELRQRLLLSSDPAVASAVALCKTDAELEILKKVVCYSAP